MNTTDFIIFYEKYGACRLAQHLGIMMNEIKHLSSKKPSAPYDLECRGLKYDVKISSPCLTSKSKKQAVWDFNLRKGEHWRPQNNECDFFILIGMKNSIPWRVFLLPSKEAPGTHVRVSIIGKSKYHQYEI
jgi:hypothetical protein